MCVPIGMCVCAWECACVREMAIAMNLIAHKHAKILHIFSTGRVGFFFATGDNLECKEKYSEKSRTY